MNDSLDLAALKDAWRALDAKLARQHALELHLFRESRLAKARTHLWPLWFGLIVQLACGLFFAVASGSFWTSHLSEPYHLAAGLTLHAYGILVIGLGVYELVLLARIDFAAPVLAIQKRLAAVRDHRIRSSPWLGLPWWVLWLLAVTSLARAAAPADPFAPLPPWIVWNLVVCSLGLLATLGFIAWSRRRPSLQEKLDHNAAGYFLGRASRYVAEIERFEREG